MGVGVIKRAVLAVLLVFAALPLYPRTKLQGHVQQGGLQLRNNGIFGAIRSGAAVTNPSVMQSYPNATVTVYQTGTLTTATIYADAAGTAKSNPFTASSNAYWSFYVDDGTYDIRFSGGGISVPFTWSGISTTGESFTVPVTGFGAICDGTTDDTAAIQAAVDVVGTHTVTLPPRRCKTTDTILIDQHRVNILGNGQYASIINFVPTSDGKAAFHFTTGANSVLYINYIKNLTIQSSDTTLQKFGIQASDTSSLTIEDVTIVTGTASATLFTGGSMISPFTGGPIAPWVGGGSSAGIKLRGREATIINRVKIYADIPIWIAKNSNAAFGMTIDADHYHISNFVGSAGSSSTSTSTNPVIYIEDGVNMTHFTIDGFNIFSGGGHAIYHNDTTTTASSNHFSASNIRHEQSNGTGLFSFHFVRNQPLYNLTFHNVQVQGPSSGWKLRATPRVVINDSDIGGAGVSIDVDSTSTSLWLNSFDANSNMTKSMGTLVLVDARENLNSLSPHRRYEYWQDPASSNFGAGKCSYFMGEQRCCYQGTLADTVTFQIPSLGGGINHGVYEVRYKGATKFGAFSAYVDAAQEFLKDTTDTSRGTTETGIGNQAGRITIDYISAAEIRLRNRLGESVNYSVCTLQN